MQPIGSFGAWTAVRQGAGASGLQPVPAGLTFAADGTWTGTDGCNGGSGRWAADDVGHLVATVGVSTAVGCNGVPAPFWLAQSRLAAVDGGTLVLVDYRGVELGRLARA